MTHAHVTQDHSRLSYLYTPQHSLGGRVGEPSAEESGYLTPGRSNGPHSDIRPFPGRSLGVTPLTISHTLLPVIIDEHEHENGHVSRADHDERKGETRNTDVPRHIAGHRPISGRQRAARGVLFGLRDLVATLFSAAVRVLIGGGIMRMRDPSAVIALLGVISVAHIGICLWIYGRIGPVVADSSQEAQDERLAATRWAKIVTVSTACAAATMVPMVYAVQRANDEDGTDGVQSAMIYATGLITQSVANPVRDLIVFLSKPDLPPTTLELSNPRSSDTRGQIHDRIEQCKRLVVLLSTISYAGLLYGTGVLADYAKAKQKNWIGDAGAGEFPHIDAWRNVFLIDCGIYVFVETLDQWSMQLIASAVQYSKGISQYLRTEEALPVTALDPAGMPDMRGEPLVTPLTGVPAALAEFLLSSTVRSNLVYACGVPSALLRNSVMRNSGQTKGFDENQSLWRQVLRGPLAFAEFRNWLYQMVSKCSLTSLPNNDSSNAPRAGGSEEIREAVANRGPMNHPFAGVPNSGSLPGSLPGMPQGSLPGSPPVSQSVMRNRKAGISPLHIPAQPKHLQIELTEDSKQAARLGPPRTLSLTPSPESRDSRQPSPLPGATGERYVAPNLIVPFGMPAWKSVPNSYPFLHSSASVSTTPQHSPVDNEFDDGT